MITPVRKRGIKTLSRRSYASFASTVVAAPQTCAPIVTQVARRIKSEMSRLSSDSHDSLLRDNIEAVKRFEWELVMLEFEKMVPTLVRLLKQIVPKPSQHVPLICLIVSQLLKARHKKMGLVQRAVSVMLYGNGASKQVCLMCM